MTAIARRPRASIGVVLTLFLSGGASACPAAGGERVTASAVSERGEITLADGREARLAGLDIPDPDRGDPKTAAAARAWLTERLVGRDVALRAMAGSPDRWGRTLVDLFAGAPGAEASVSRAALSAGFARVRPEAEARDCLVERLAAEAGARSAGLGLWADPYYGVVAASDLDELRRRDARFVVVEGVVKRVGEGRSRIWVDFGRRDGFSAVVSARQAKAFERAGVTITALAGATIRLRGALDNRFGIRMPLFDPGQIEVISKAPSESEAKPEQ